MTERNYLEELLRMNIALARREIEIVKNEHRIQDLCLLLEQRDREIEQLRDALIWCSGSPSFAPGGEAHVGWTRIRETLLSPRGIGLSALREEVAENYAGGLCSLVLVKRRFHANRSEQKRYDLRFNEKLPGFGGVLGDVAHFIYIGDLPTNSFPPIENLKVDFLCLDCGLTEDDLRMLISSPNLIKSKRRYFNFDSL